MGQTLGLLSVTEGAPGHTAAQHSTCSRNRESPATLHNKRIGPSSNAKKESNVPNGFQLPLLSILTLFQFRGKVTWNRLAGGRQCIPTVPPWGVEAAVASQSHREAYFEIRNTALCCGFPNCTWSLTFVDTVFINASCFYHKSELIWSSETILEQVSVSVLHILKERKEFYSFFKHEVWVSKISRGQEIIFNPNKTREILLCFFFNDITSIYIYLLHIEGDIVLGDCFRVSRYLSSLLRNKGWNEEFLQDVTWCLLGVWQQRDLYKTGTLWQKEWSKLVIQRYRGLRTDIQTHKHT